MKQSIKGRTLSVIMPDSTTVHTYVEVNGESCNLTLRLDRGKAAVLCGYPMAWGVHDTHIDYYDSESPVYSEMEFLGDLDLPDEMQPKVYVSQDTERAIMRQLRNAVARQFRSKDWHKTCPKRRQSAILRQIDNAIKGMS